MGLWDLFGGKGRKRARAHRKELAGQLDEAIADYLAAEEADEAARVVLLKADAERDPDQRLVLCAQAVRLAPDGEHGQRARRRKAALSFDLVRAAGGTTLQSELRNVAEELESCEHWEKAVEAYRLLDDFDAEVRVLKKAGAIHRLEHRLEQTQAKARRERDRAALLSRMKDLERLAERRKAIQQAQAWLKEQDDEAVAWQLEQIRAKLLRGPAATLLREDKRCRYLLGSELTIGRARADIVVASSAISRQHLRLFRQGGEAHVEDLDTRNGTSLAGAKLSGAIPVGSGLSLSLADQVACKITPDDDDGVCIAVAGSRYHAPLGPLKIGAWELQDAHDGNDRFVSLHTAPGQTTPHREGLRLGPHIELALGDEFSAERDGPIVLAVPVDQDE